MTQQSESRKFYQKPLFVIAAIFLAIFVGPEACNGIRWLRMDSSERFLDTASYDTRRKQEDTIQLYKQRLVEEDFDAKYSAEEWYGKFSSNKVAFDKKYTDSILDVTGEISRIRNEDGCAIVEMKGDHNPFDILEFSNCPTGKDNWSDEVAKAEVGYKVHIRGTYTDRSSDFEMDLYNCHIITP